MKSYFLCDNEISFLFPRHTDAINLLNILYFMLPDDVQAGQHM
jgi:hypothetical protein